MFLLGPPVAVENCCPQSLWSESSINFQQGMINATPTGDWLPFDFVVPNVKNLFNLVSNFSLCRPQGSNCSPSVSHNLRRDGRTISVLSRNSVMELELVLSLSFKCLEYTIAPSIVSVFPRPMTSASIPPHPGTF